MFMIELSMLPYDEFTFGCLSTLVTMPKGDDSILEIRENVPLFSKYGEGLNVLIYTGACLVMIVIMC